MALRDVDPTIVEEMRYAGPNNFVGRRVHGYREDLADEVYHGRPDRAFHTIF